MKKGIKKSIEKEKISDEGMVRNIVKKRENKQILWILIIILLVLGVVIGLFVYSQMPRYFELAGLKWNLIKEGNVLFYHTHFLATTDYHLYLRNDPRTNNIPLNCTFKFYRNVTVTIDKDAGECPGAIMGNYILGSFLAGTGAIVKGAITNKTYAEEQKLIYADCSDAVNQTIIKLKKSETPFIEKEGNCYIINVGNCENLKASEKFIVGILEQMNKNE